MCPVGLRLSDRGAAARYGFTMYPVGLRLLILWLLPGMASPCALWGFICRIVGLLPGMASPCALWGFVC